MAKMPTDLKEMIVQQRFVPLATATPDGIPNVVPIGAKKVLDDETILISDQYFNKTLANLRANPSVAITVWTELKGYQLKGKVTIQTSGPLFEETAEWIEELGQRMGVPMTSKGAVVVHVTEIYDVSPGRNAGARIA